MWTGAENPPPHRDSVPATASPLRTGKLVTELHISLPFGRGAGMAWSIQRLGYGLDGSSKSVVFCLTPRPAVGPMQPPVQCVPGIKRPGPDTDRSSPSSAGVMNEWIYTISPLTCRHGVGGDNFTLSLSAVWSHDEPVIERLHYTHFLFYHQPV